MEGIFTHNDQLYPDIFLLSQDNYSLDDGYFFSKHQPQQEQHGEISDFGLLDEDVTRFNAASPPLETCLEEIEFANLRKEGVPVPAPEFDQPRRESKLSDEFASLKLLSNHRSGLTRLVSNEQAQKPSVTQAKKLSTDEVLRIAGARFVQSSSPATTHPFACSFSGFSVDEAREIALAELLLACAEKVGCQQHERARKLLDLCERSCSDTGSAFERASYYFCAALKERVDKETGRHYSPSPPFDFDRAMMRMNATKHAMHEYVPFSQLSLFPGVQAIVERVDDATRIHVIDLGIRSGLQWTVLMQALASRNGCSPIERLRITAIGTSEKDLIEETGKRLSSFAESLNIPFSFNAVMVPGMAELNEDLFEPDPDEAVAVYTSHVLRSMLWKPDQLESLMRVMTGLNPRVLVVIEVEASHNSPAFVTRFIEALFFFGAFFDCLETFMKGDDENRKICESLYFGQGIRDMVANEGAERKVRHVSVDVWRAFFARYGFENVELSTSSIYQAMLILKKFRCEESCTIEKNGECAIFRWKDTPIQSLSVFAKKN